MEQDIDIDISCGTPTDSCMNQDNWNNCVSLVQSGCTDVLILESCPVKFLCNDDTNNNYDVCGDPTWPCWNDDVWRSCKSLVDDGCSKVMKSKSCPVQFICLPETDTGTKEEELGDEVTFLSAKVCRNATDTCMNENNWNACQKLVNNGCKSVTTIESCPLQFACDNTDLMDASKYNICGEPTDPCIDKNIWSRCVSLVDSGCEDIAVMESCPVQFSCQSSGYVSNITITGSNNETTSTVSTVLVASVAVGGVLLVVVVLFLSYSRARNRAEDEDKDRRRYQEITIVPVHALDNVDA